MLHYREGFIPLPVGTTRPQPDRRMLPWNPAAIRRAWSGLSSCQAVPNATSCHNERPKLSDPAHGTQRGPPRRSRRVRGSAGLDNDFILQCCIVLSLSGPLVNGDTRAKCNTSPSQVVPARVVKIKDPTVVRLYAPSDRGRKAALGRSLPQKCHCEILRCIFVGGIHWVGQSRIVICL